jgi:hypothetical protein
MYDEKLPAEDVSRRAHELYDREIRPNLKDEHFGRYLVVDVESGAYQADDNALDATRALRERKPEATIHLMRVNSDGAATAAYRFGGRSLSRS